MSSKEATETRYTIKSLEKALNILEFIALAERELSLKEIAENLEIGKGTVHRILGTLKQYKYIRQDQGTRDYGLGIRLAELVPTIRQEELYQKILMPTLKRLAARCKEGVNAGILDYDEIVYVVSLESEENLRFSIKAGTRLPAHCTAMGKALIASLPDEIIEQRYGAIGSLKSMTRNSIRTYDEFFSEISRIRVTGLAFDYEECYLGVRCVATPVWNAQGAALTSISISGPTVRMMTERMESLSLMIKDAAADISLEL